MSSLSNLENASSLLPGKAGTRVRKMANSQINVGDHVQLNDEFFVQHQAMKQVQKIIENKLVEANEEAEQQAENIKTQATNQAQVIIDNATLEAEKIIKAAEEKANELLNNTDETLKAASDKAYESAYADAYKEMADKIHISDSLLHQASYTSSQLKKSYAEDLAGLVSSIVKSILGCELKKNPERLLKVVEEAIESIGMLHDSSATVIIHPDSLKDIGFTDAEALKRLRFVPDTDCPRGRIYLDTANSRWDISPELQAQLYIEAVMPQLEEKLNTIESSTNDH